MGSARIKLNELLRDLRKALQVPPEHNEQRIPFKKFDAFKMRIESEAVLRHMQESIALDLESGRERSVVLASIAGVSGTPHEGGIFSVELHLPENYPICPPNIRFLTKAWHPNIDPQSGCLSCTTFEDDWSPGMYHFLKVAICVQLLLASPDSCSVINQEAAEQHEGDRKAYFRKVDEWVKRYATLQI